MIYPLKKNSMYVSIKLLPLLTVWFYTVTLIFNYYLYLEFQFCLFVRLFVHIVFTQFINFNFNFNFNLINSKI